MDGNLPDDLRDAEVIDMTPVTTLPRVGPDDPKIAAYAQCMPSHLPLWFEATRADLGGRRFAAVVTEACAVNFYKLRPWTETHRDPEEDASFAITGMVEHGDRVIGMSASCAVYLDSDFSVEEVTFYTSPSGAGEDLCRLTDDERHDTLLNGRWDELHEMTKERIAGDHLAIHDAVIPTLQALSLLAHGIAVLEDRGVSRNRANRRHSRLRTRRRGPVKTMRLHAPTGQTKSDRRQSLHWRAEHWAPADRGALGRFVDKGTGQEELVWHPGRWVGDPAIEGS